MSPFLHADKITVESITVIPVFSLLISIHLNSKNNKNQKENKSISTDRHTYG